MMKNTFTTALLINGVSALLMLGCSSVEEEMPKEAETDLSTQIIKSENSQVLSVVPDWFLETKINSRGAITENATAKSNDVQFALNKAILLAEQQVVKKLAVEFSSIEINETAESNNGSFNQSAEQLIEARVNNAGLFGHTVSKKEIVIDPVTGEFRAFVQVYLSPSARADVLKSASEKDQKLQELKQLQVQIKQLEQGQELTPVNTIAAKTIIDTSNVAY